MTRRTRRADSTFVIYEARSPEGENYIGVTGKTESSPLSSAIARWKKHRSRGVHEEREWPLYRYLRERGGLDMLWTITVIETVRGRAEAYARERNIVLERKPTLNEQYAPIVMPTPSAPARFMADDEAARRVAEADAILSDPTATQDDVERAMRILAGEDDGENRPE